MNTPKQMMEMLVIAMLGSIAVESAAMAGESVQEAYVKAYASMGKQAAMWTASQTGMITAQAEAQAALMNARANMLKTVVEARGTEAKTLHTLQEVRSKVLDNDLKSAQTFYEKRNVRDAYQAQHPRKRPSREDLVRYSKAAAPKRPTDYEMRGSTIYWPAALQEEEFSECRVQLDYLFAQRTRADAGPGSETFRQAKEPLAQMRDQLRSQIRQMDPAEYLQSRKFIDNLAYETRFSHRIEGIAAR